MALKARGAGPLYPGVEEPEKCSVLPSPLGTPLTLGCLSRLLAQVFLLLIYLLALFSFFIALMKVSGLFFVLPALFFTFYCFSGSACFTLYYYFYDYV